MITLPSAFCIWGDSIAKGVIWNESRNRYVICPDSCVKQLSRHATIPVNSRAIMGCTTTQCLDNFDENDLITLKDQKTVEELKAFVEEFLDIYVIFAGCANDSHEINYQRVIKYVVPGSKLAQRMLDLEGMQFAQSRGDEVADIDIHHYLELSEDSYLCDVTYKVDTIGREGLVQTTTNAKILIVRSGDALLVESMIGY